MTQMRQIFTTDITGKSCKLLKRIKTKGPFLSLGKQICDHLVENILRATLSQQCSVTTTKLQATEFKAQHPLLQEKCTGLETACLWKPFFLSFLAKTKQEQPLPGQVYC